MNDAKKVQNSKKIFAANDIDDDALLNELRAACRSLQFISETDADIVPLKVAAPKSRSLASYLKALDIDPKDIEEVTFENFFDRLTMERDWFGPREIKRAERFANLRDLLAKHLKSLRVIRAGKIRIDIYIVGISQNGRLAGVKTKAIET